MDSLQNYLIEICSAYLEDRQISLSDDVDYDGLYRLANAHNLSGIVFCVLNTAPDSHTVPKEAFKRFENDFLEAVVRYDFQSRQIAEIDSLLDGAGIRHIFFKGAVIRDLFPVPEARAMGDVDVLICLPDRNRVKKLLTDKGFVCENSNGNVYDYRKEGLLCEVHTKIISGTIGGCDLETTFEKATDHAFFNGTNGVLDDNYHFAYLIAHIAHHFWFYGAGIKLILDLAVMMRTKSINIEKVIEYLKPCKLETFAKTILTVTYNWFGCGQAFNVSTDSTEDFLLSYGAFGNTGRNKSAVITRKELESGHSGNGFSTKLRLLFPSYARVKNIPYIRFIDGRPYLLPAAWVYRIYYNLRYRRKFTADAAKNIGSDDTKKEAQRELAFFQEIGLL